MPWPHRYLLPTAAAALSLLLAIGPAAGQDPRDLRIMEDVHAQGIRYIQQRYNVAGRGAIQEGMLYGLSAKRLPAASEAGIARAVALPIRAAANACEVEDGGILYSGAIETLGANEVIMFATYTQRAGGGWGAFDHRLRFVRERSSWTLAEEISRLNVHGDCGRRR